MSIIKTGGMKLAIAGIVAAAVLIAVGIYISGRSDPAPAPAEVTGGEVEALENKLTALLNSMSGVSGARVMLFAESEGGRRFVRDTDGQTEKNVVLGSGSSERLELCETISPKLIGAAVVIPGAGEGLCAEVTLLVSSLLGLSAAKVYVGG